MIQIMADMVDDVNLKSERNMKVSSINISYHDIAQKLLSDNLLLTALELHTELVEAGREVPRLREFFSNPGNFEQQALIRPEVVSIPRSSSQVTLDSLDLTRYSEDGERGVDERVAVLEFELRKAKETINALRAHLTVATESEATTPDAGSYKQCQNEGIKPHEQRALNFLINEYLLLHGYKLTSITFADENEDQDFEDWDDVGLNIPKPQELLVLYREFIRHVQVPCCSVGVQTDEDVDRIEMENEIRELRVAVSDSKEQVSALERDKLQLEQRLWCPEEGRTEVALAEASTSPSPSPERFELIEPEAKSSEELLEDTENSRIEDDSSAVVSLADTDGWTRVNHSQNGGLENPSSPPGSSVENLPEMLNSTILFNTLASRSLPVAFQKEVLLRCFVNTVKSQETHLLDDILNDGISEERLVYILGRSLPRIIPNVILNKREELLPLIISTIHLHPEASERDLLLNLLFNLKKRPQEDERRVILSGVVCIAQCSGPSLVENEILPQCWEQISHKYVERRLLVAESCCALAPFVSSSIRNSLMLSMLQQMLLEDKDEVVREVVVRSLTFLVAFMDDPDKYLQCEELAMTALDDPSPNVVGSTTRILLPVLAKWAQELSKLHTSLLTNLLMRLEKQMKTSTMDSSPTTGHRSGLDSDQRLAWTLTALQTLLPYLVVTAVAVQPVMACISQNTIPIETSEVLELGSGLTNPSIFYEGEFPVNLLLGAFDACMENEQDWPEVAWITVKLIPQLLDALKFVQVGNELVITTFIKFFRHLSAGFGKNFLKNRLKPIFVHRLQELEKALSESRTSWPSLTIIPVYIVGILAARRDAGACEELEGLLKRFVCALPVCGAPTDCLEVTVRNLCETTTLHDTILAALWDAVVHPRAAVRSAAATLFVSTIGNISEVLVSSRVAPALVTLASDPDISVRTATIPAFGSLITSTTVKEVQDKTYMQLQSFLADPSTRDNHAMLVQLVSTMGRIVSSCETWFREEVILPQLAAMSAYTLQLSNQTRRLDLAVALIEAFSSAVCCSLSKQTISTVLLPGLRYLEPVSSQSLLAHHDTVVAMIKGAESRVETHYTNDRSGSITLSLAGANVGQGVEEVKQKVTKYFHMKPPISRPANLPSLPGLFRKK